MAHDTLRIQVRDSNGHSTWIGLRILTTATTTQVNDLLGALELMTQCAIAQASRESTVYGPETDLGAEGAYSTHRDVATLLLRGPSSVRDTKLQIPGPYAACFGADTETLLPTAAQVQPFLEAVAAIGIDKDGEPLNFLTRGYRDFLPQ